MPTLTRLPPKGSAAGVAVFQPPSSPSSSSSASSAKENFDTRELEEKPTSARPSAAKTKTEEQAQDPTRKQQQRGERRKLIASFFISPPQSSSAKASKKRKSAANASDKKTPKKPKRKTPLFVPLNEKSKPIFVTAPMIGCEKAAKMAIPSTCLAGRDDLFGEENPLVIEEIPPYLRDNVTAFLGGFGR